MFVAVYQKALKLLYVDELLERVNKAFAPRYKPGVFEYPEFDATFQARGPSAGRRLLTRTPCCCFSRKPCRCLLCRRAVCMCSLHCVCRPL